MRYATPREASQALQVSEKTLRNWDTEGLLSFLGQVLCGNVREVVVNRKDRLVRLGLDLIEWLCQQKDGKLVVLNRCYLSNE